MAFQRKKPAAIGFKAPFPGFIEPALASAIGKVRQANAGFTKSNSKPGGNATGVTIAGRFGCRRIEARPMGRLRGDLQRENGASTSAFRVRNRRSARKAADRRFQRNLI
jgi:hypothetical protein